MVLQGETLATGARRQCPDCHTKLEEEILHSAAGFYVGTRCDCGPATRESGYFNTYQGAEVAWKIGGYQRR